MTVYCISSLKKDQDIDPEIPGTCDELVFVVGLWSSLTVWLSIYTLWELDVNDYSIDLRFLYPKRLMHVTDTNILDICSR